MIGAAAMHLITASVNAWKRDNEDETAIIESGG